MNNSATHYNVKKVIDAKIVGNLTVQQIQSNVLDFTRRKQVRDASHSVISNDDITPELLERMRYVF